MGFEQVHALPGMKVDENNRKVYFDSQADILSGLENFYQSYLDGNINAFSVSEEIAPGFSAMINAVKNNDIKPVVMKGQLTGPTTLGLIAKDQRGQALLYHEQIMDVLVKATSLKAAWMAAKMSEVAEIPIIFFDEPMLQSIGSAAIQIDRRAAVERLREAIQRAGCLTGGHCCGNTDWSILMEAGLDIIALDAWHFAETLALYPSELRVFVGRGGLIAWGIVPASREGAASDPDIFESKLWRAIRDIAEKTGLPEEQLVGQSLVTPSCGLGSLSEEDSASILRKTAAVAGLLPKLLS